MTELSSSFSPQRRAAGLAQPHHGVHRIEPIDPYAHQRPGLTADSVGGLRTAAQGTGQRLTEDERLGIHRRQVLPRGGYHLRRRSGRSELGITLA